MQAGYHFASKKEDSSYIAILYLRVPTAKKENVEGMVYKVFILFRVEIFNLSIFHAYIYLC